MLAIDDELEEAFYQRNDVTYFYDHCTYDTAKKQLEKIIIDFRTGICCRNESGCEYSYQLEKRDHQQLHNCG